MPCMGESFQLAGLVSLGDEDAAAMGEEEFRSLYEATARPITAYLAGVTGRRDVAEDLLQETYCRFLTRKPAAMDANETRRYLFRVATNLLRDRWRRGDDAPSPEVAEDGFSVDMDTQMDVRAVMRMLRPRERELLWLAYVEGMNHAEIAEATGLRVLSVRMLLYRARKRAAGLLLPRLERV
jgi:RNA polymerase sigma-70 factor, ECF subfamily